MTSSDTTAGPPSFRERVSAYLHEHPRLRRELYFAVGALGAGLIALPLLIFLAGSLTLGAYESGRLGAFLADFYGGLVRGWLPVWGVVLGPYALLLFLRSSRFILRRFLTPTGV